MTPICVEREIGGRTLKLETGVVAKLASSAVMATYGGTTVLATVVRAEPRPGLDFFPLTVDYRERTSAGGKFPGGFRKREGPPNEKEILTMRMIDRPIRPLFPDGFIDEIQIQCWVMSHDGENDADVLAGTAAAAALAISDAPYQGPTATVRVGRLFMDEGPRFVINPTATQQQYSDLDLVLAGHRDGVNMIEVGAAQTPDEVVLEALRFGYEHVRQELELIEELVAKAGVEKRQGELALPPQDIVDLVAKHCKQAVVEARKEIPGKQERKARLDEVKQRMLDELFPEKLDGSYGEYAESAQRRRWASEAFRLLEKKVVRELIVNEGVRPDGRGPEEIRPIECELGLFERTHGSALFQRGETQSVVTCTLGTAGDEQIVDGLMPEYSKKFMLHYNFPPFCVGEARRITGPGRREIGHGALAERSLLGILPSPEEFMYTIRLVSDITESNGSSSMASVCGGSLALMDAGVPVSGHCAGVSVGRFTDESGQKEVYVTDIIGEEDFFGDMDFKVAGTRKGVTGVQLDLKARGLSLEQIGRVFEQARRGREQILDIMERAIDSPRKALSRYAPKLRSFKIDPEKIGKLIGPGGKMINALQDRYSVKIDVEEDGTVVVSGSDLAKVEACSAEIEAMCAEVKIGAIYRGKVVGVKDFGVFVELAPGTDGMCHISELAEGYVEKVSDVAKVGDELLVKVINVDDQGRIKLSHRQALAEAGAQEQQAEA